VFTNTSHFPDVNVWVALTHNIHPHHSAAKAWEDSLSASDILVFCRITQLGLLRLLTNPSALGGDVLTQAGAWKCTNRFLRLAQLNSPVNRRELTPYSGVRQLGMRFQPGNGRTGILKPFKSPHLFLFLHLTGRLLEELLAAFLWVDC
jgi:hypothetical protein